MSRATYVYRLVVRHIPEDRAHGHTGWPVASGWYPPEFEYFRERHDRDPHSDGPWQWNWPRRRNYLSREAAEGAAQRMREWGADVEVIRSLPVEFPSP